MALGRALINVLIIDDGKPCNIQTPISHNFLTNDGTPPTEIAALAKEQVGKYATVAFCNSLATSGFITKDGFEISIATGETFSASKLLFATGIRDLLPDIKGLAACWGISVLHCPYCHGYEVRHEKTGILGNGNEAFEFAKLIYNWTDDLTLFTNGASHLSTEQTACLGKHNIQIVEMEMVRVVHAQGNLQYLLFKDGSEFAMKALYSPAPFQQNCSIPQYLGCALNDEGYIEIDSFQRTSVPGVFASGDNTTRMRTVANAVSSGTSAGIVISKELILEAF